MYSVRSPINPALLSLGMKGQRYFLVLKMFLISLSPPVLTGRLKVISVCFSFNLDGIISKYSLCFVTSLKFSICARLGGTNTLG